MDSEASTSFHITRTYLQHSTKWLCIKSSLVLCENLCSYYFSEWWGIYVVVIRWVLMLHHLCQLWTYWSVSQWWIYDYDLFNKCFSSQNTTGPTVAVCKHITLMYGKKLHHWDINLTIAKQYSWISHFLWTIIVECCSIAVAYYL